MGTEQVTTDAKRPVWQINSVALTALVGVDNFRCAEFGKRLQGDGNFVHEHLAASDIDHSGQVNEAFGNGNVGGVQCPDLVSPDDGQVP